MSDLRSAYSEESYRWVIRGAEEQHADEFMKFLAAAATDPVLRLSLLDLIGADVREGWVHEDYGTWWVSPVPEDAHPSYRAFVVRPRGEAT